MVCFSSGLTTDAPFNTVTTRAQVLQPEFIDPQNDYGGLIISFEGETLQINISGTSAIIIFEVLKQDNQGSQPITIAQTAWDPWDDPVLKKCFMNWELCNPEFNQNVLWNPKDLDPVNSFVEYFLKLSPAGGDQSQSGASPSAPSDIPGRLSFQATHLGPLMAIQQRQNPYDTPIRQSRLGDTVRYDDYPGPFVPGDPGPFKRIEPQTVSETSPRARSVYA